MCAELSEISRKRGFVLFACVVNRSSCCCMPSDISSLIAPSLCARFIFSLFHICNFCFCFLCKFYSFIYFTWTNFTFFEHKFWLFPILRPEARQHILTLWSTKQYDKGISAKTKADISHTTEGQTYGVSIISLQQGRHSWIKCVNGLQSK